LLDTQLLDSDVLDQTVRDIDDIAGQVSEQLEPVVNPVTDAVVDPLTDPLAKPVTELLDAVPLDALTDVLPILTRTGETAFVDVAVENGWRAVERELSCLYCNLYPPRLLSKPILPDWIWC
jgi:hypothetical protein